MAEATTAERMAEVRRLFERIIHLNEVWGLLGKQVIVGSRIWRIQLESGWNPRYIIDCDNHLHYLFLLRDGLLMKKARSGATPEFPLNPDEIDWLIELLKATANCDPYHAPVFPVFGPSWRQTLAKRRHF